MSIGVSISTKPCVGHRRAQRRVDRRAEAQVALHRRAAQVQVAVPEPQHLVDVVGPLRERERRRLGLVQHLERSSRSTSTAPVGRSALTVPSGRARTSPSMRSTHSRPTPVHRVAERGRVGDDLDDPGGVAQVEEHDAAVVAAGRDPAAERDRRADVLGPQRAHHLRAHHRATADPDARRSFSHEARPLSGTSTCSPDLEILHCHRVARGFVASEHHAEACARPVRRPSTARTPNGRRTHGRRRVPPRAARSPAPSPARLPPSPSPSTTNASSRRDDGVDRRGLEREHEPFDPGAEPDARASADRPSPRPARRSGRRRRARSAPRRARRSGTRTWCACSSRSRARGAASSS